MILGKNRLRLRRPISQRTPPTIVRAARPDLAWLDKVASNRYTCLVAYLVAHARRGWGRIHVGSKLQRMRGEKACSPLDLECRRRRGPDCSGASKQFAAS